MIGEKCGLASEKQKRPSQEAGWKAADFSRKVLEIGLAARSMSQADLARRLGVSRSALSQAIKAGLDNRRTRAAIEVALDYLPLWDDPKRLQLRRACLARLGFDPALLTYRQLKTKMIELGIERRSTGLQGDYLEDTISWFAARFPLKTNTPHQKG